MARSRSVEAGFEGYTPFGSGLVCHHVNTLHLLFLPQQTAIPAAVTSRPWWTEIPTVVKLKEALPEVASFCQDLSVTGRTRPTLALSPADNGSPSCLALSTWPISFCLVSLYNTPLSLSSQASL